MNENCSHPVSTNETDTILRCMGFLGLSSVIVCFTSVVLVFVFKLYIYFVHRLALYQVLAALSYGIALTLELLFLIFRKDDEKNRWLCETVGFFSLYFAWVKLLFTAWLVVHLFCQAVLHKDPQKDHKCYEVLCLMISIVFPLLFTWIPFVNEDYGPAGAWCWIQSWNNDCIDNLSIAGVTEQFALWYGPAMFLSVVESIAIIVIVFCILFCYQPNDVPTGTSKSLLESSNSSTSLLESSNSSAQKRCKALNELLPLLAYPILFCLLLIPPLFNRIIGAAYTGQQPNITAILVSGIFVPLQPFFAGLTLFIHVLVLKICCRHTRYERLSTTYANAWVFIGATSTSTTSTNSKEMEESVHSDKELCTN